MPFDQALGAKRTLGVAKLAGLIGAAVGVLLSTPASARAQQKQQPKETRAKQRQLNLRNTTSDTITIELRLGDAPDCAANPPAASQMLPPGREWLIATPRPICWRRTDTRASIGLSSWHRHVLKTGEQLKIGI